MPKVYYKNCLEIACFSVEACVIAEKSGADRIEFCSDYNVGGITPNHEDILRVRELIKIPIHIIIRPRSGNFIYSKAEIEIMKQDIFFCKMNGINGVVFGALNSLNKIDLEINKELVDIANPMPVTFHRAIDECENIEDALIDLIGLGIKRVLTSGGMKNAMYGVDELKTLNGKFGTRIIIMPGGGIRSSNLENLIQETGCIEYHSSAITDNSDFIDLKEIQRLTEKIRQV